MIVGCGSAPDPPDHQPAVRVSAAVAPSRVVEVGRDLLLRHQRTVLQRQVKSPPKLNWRLVSQEGRLNRRMASLTL